MEEQTHQVPINNSFQIQINQSLYNIFIVTVTYNIRSIKIKILNYC